MISSVPKLPIAVIDFEASALERGYPIEVGVAIWSDIGSLVSWSSLIQREEVWRSNLNWDEGSGRIHKIPIEQLEFVPTAKEIAAFLNRILGPIGVAYSDAPPLDSAWLTTLFAAAELTPSFNIETIALLPDYNGPRIRKWLQQNPSPHRAGEDASLLLRAYAYGLKIRTGRPRKMISS